MGFATRLNNIVRSLLVFVSEKMVEEGYVIGTAEGQLTVYDEFPSDELPTDFHIPAISLSYVSTGKGKSYDMGETQKETLYNFIYYFWGRTKLERDGVLNKIKEWLETYSVPIKDYYVEEEPNIGYLRINMITSSPRRIAAPGDLQKWKGAIDFAMADLKEGD